MSRTPLVLFFELLEAFDEIGLKQMIADYFREAPVLSLAKTAQRRCRPTPRGAGIRTRRCTERRRTRSIVWLPVSRCGDIAPGLALWPRRLDYVVDTDGADHSISVRIPKRWRR